MSKKYTWEGTPITDFTRKKLIEICKSLMERIIELDKRNK